MTLNPLTLLQRWLFNRSRFVFRYWNGHRIALGDPMVLWRELQQCEDFKEDDFKLMKVEALRPKIIGRLAGVVRQVFSVGTPDQAGLTEMECLELLRQYIDYAGFQKKSGDPMQTSPSTSEPEVSVESTPEPITSDVSEST